MGIAEQFSPGELVRARGREWVVVEAHAALSLRPLTGSEAEIETILPELEVEPVVYATFDAPDATRSGGREAAQLLRDALRLSLRRGAGPFRSAGRLNFAPRAYQLAPLMMALRQATVRLLNADDVGVGKTIETGLILREFLDRGEIDRFTVLCPPHLVDQWTQELETKFSIPATPVTASAAARLERDLPYSTSIFEAYPYTVVSLDFIKSERRFFDFKRACPEMVVVDEAHSAVRRGRSRQRRYELVRSLADDRERHLILLTATPHSGDEEAFHNLLGLIDEAFAALPELAGEAQRNLREKLAAHFIQRRRSDIDAWREPGLFPQHETSELKYRLTGDYEDFYGQILDYCAEIVLSAEGDARQRLAFWGTLALMRCVGSSPAAAARALKTRAQFDPGEISETHIAAQTLDDEELAEDDLEPGAGVEDPHLAALIGQAEALAGKIEEDPKYRALVKALKELIREGFSPVVFCRYIATAGQVAAALAEAFKSHTVEVVTGMLPSEEREIRVEELGGRERRILVATDCLSEGINLQAWFDAVIHYDLSWNPTRHQQREGRVDRFGQKSATVRSVLIYGENNPVDGAVLNVILRKARAIEKQTGVRVPLPDENGSLTKALMSAVLLRAQKDKQMTLDPRPGLRRFRRGAPNRNGMVECVGERETIPHHLRAKHSEARRGRQRVGRDTVRPRRICRHGKIRHPGDEAAERSARTAFTGRIPGARPSDAREFPRTLRRRKPHRRRDGQADRDRLFRAAARGLHLRTPRPPFARRTGRDFSRAGPGRVYVGRRSCRSAPHRRLGVHRR